MPQPQRPGWSGTGRVHGFASPGLPSRILGGAGAPRGISPGTGKCHPASSLSVGPSALQGEGLPCKMPPRTEGLGSRRFPGARDLKAGGKMLPCKKKSMLPGSVPAHLHQRVNNSITAN